MSAPATPGADPLGRYGPSVADPKPRSTSPSRPGVDWERMEAVRVRDLRSDFRDLTAGQRIEQGVALSRLATALAGRAEDQLDLKRLREARG